MQKLFLSTLLVFSSLFVAIDSVHAQSDDALMRVFVSSTCPHCADLKEFMSEWDDAPSVMYYDITGSETYDAFAKVMDRMEGVRQVVPTIVFDGRVIQGYDKDETTGVLIQKLYEDCSLRRSCITFDEFIAGEGSETITLSTSTCDDDPLTPCELDLNENKFVFDFWFVGEKDLRDFSLPVLSIVLGGLDGFNPCAMWVLITLLTLLINTRSLSKILIIGGTFLLVSGVMYYMFIAAWLNVFLIVGYNFWVQKIIGLVAVGGGGFYLYEAFGKNPDQCKVTNPAGRKKVIEKMKHAIHASSLLFMILGVGILAISVNMIELVCSAGLPAIFTQILAINPITVAARYMYIFLYILAYMFDDLVIYTIAISTLHATGITTKYQRFSLTFGGVLMAGLGILLIFYPQALMIG